MSPARQRNRKGEGERLRAELLAAAADLLATAGDVRAVTVRDIATSAGVTPPALYRLFDDKEAIVRAVIAERFAAFEQAVDGASRGAEDPYVGLRRRCQAYLAFAAEHPGHYRLLFSTSHLGPVAVGTDEGRHPGAPSFQRLRADVEACIDAGADAALPAEELAVEAWSLLHGLADLRITKPEMPWPSSVTILDHFLEAVGLTR